MDIFLIVMIPIIMVVSFITIFLVYKRKKINVNGVSHMDDFNKNNLDDNHFNLGPELDSNIKIEKLSASDINGRWLYEITDNIVIARISETIPTIAEKVAKTVTDKALKDGEIYRAIIPSGEKLVRSKQMEGAARGIYRNAKGVKGHANFAKVDSIKNISNVTKVANSVANVMNVGSLIVGQYYMSEVNSRLEKMNKGIDRISDFQDRELKSRILSLLSLVKEISQFSSEIMENDDQRKIKLATIEILKGTATELLGQVNLTIKEVLQRNSSPDYKEYQEKVDELNSMVTYQNILLSGLEGISKLSYILGKGDAAIEQCYAQYKIYLDQSQKTRNILGQWHERQIELLNIDLDKGRISRRGVDGFFLTIPALINDDLKYRELKHGLSKKISNQSITKQNAVDEPEAPYDEDVQIIIKEGRYYYVHELHDNERLD